MIRTNQITWVTWNNILNVGIYYNINEQSMYILYRELELSH